MNIGADGLKTGFTKEAGLRPGRLGGAERPAPDRGRQRPARRKRSAPTKARSCSNGASTISSPRLAVRRRPGDRAKPRSMAATRGTCRWSAARAVRLMVPRGTREKIIARVVYTGPVRGAGEGGPEDRHAQGLARRLSWCSKCRCRPPKSVGTGIDAAARLRCRHRAGDRPVPRRLPAAMIGRSGWRIAMAD